MLLQLTCRDSLCFIHRAEMREGFRGFISNVLPLHLFVFQCAKLPLPFCENLARVLTVNLSLRVIRPTVFIKCITTIQIISHFF